MSQSPRFSLLEVMGSNAFLLSAVYLVLGALVEAGRRFLPPSGIGELFLRLSVALDALPARILDGTGLMDALRIGYLDGQLSGFGIRLAFGATTIALIFVVAALSGLALAGLRRAVVGRTAE